jgi:hypothetical protein
LTLTTSVFMKRIRALVYQSIYKVNSKDYNGKRVSNLIYTLAPAKTGRMPVQGLDQPSELLQKIACHAFDMDTTLWFTSQSQSPCLTASGQASLCLNLMKSIARRYGDDPKEYPEVVSSQYRVLKEDWNRFNADPFFQLKELSIEEDWQEVLREVNELPCDWGMFAKQLPSAEELY